VLVRDRLAARDVGPGTIGVLVLAQAVLWAIARPSGETTASYLGQLLGAESVLLLSIGLVLVSMLPWVEHWFDGIDRAAIWHRRVAIAGLVLLAPHLLLSSSREGTALGGPLGVIGVVGLAVLASWAILPRWQSVVPAVLRGVVLALRDAWLEGRSSRRVRLDAALGGARTPRARGRTAAARRIQPARSVDVDVTPACLTVSAPVEDEITESEHLEHDAPVVRAT
jgi:hypothetical protein